MAFLLLQTAQLAATHEIVWATKSPGHKGDEITIVSGDSLIFGDGDGGTWAGGHDVFKVNSKSKFDKCDADAAKILVTYQRSHGYLNLSQRDDRKKLTPLALAERNARLSIINISEPTRS